MYPREMNSKEKSGLKSIKESGLSYEIFYDQYQIVGYWVKVFELKGAFKLDESEPFQKALNNHYSKLINQKS